MTSPKFCTSVLTCIQVTTTKHLSFKVKAKRSLPLNTPVHHLFKPTLISIPVLRKKRKPSPKRPLSLGKRCVKNARGDRWTSRRKSRRFSSCPPQAPSIKPGGSIGEGDPRHKRQEMASAYSQRTGHKVRSVREVSRRKPQFARSSTYYIIHR